MKKIVIYLLIAVMFSGCSYRIVDFTIISTKNIDLSKASKFQRGKTRTEGQDLVHVIIYLELGKPNMKEAIDRAIEKVPGCIALVDGVIYEKGWWAILYGQTILVVEGTPLIDPSLAMIDNDIPEYYAIKIDNNGNVKSYNEIDENEFANLKQKFNKNDVKKHFKSTSEL